MSVPLPANQTELTRIIRCLETSVKKGLRSQQTDAKVKVPARIAIPVLYLVLWAVDALQNDPTKWNSHFQDLFQDMGYFSTNVSLLRQRVTEWIDQITGRDFASYLVGLDGSAGYKEIPEGDLCLGPTLLMCLLKVAIDQAKTLQRETLFPSKRLRFWMDK